jgi:protein SCO1/2
MIFAVNLQLRAPGMRFALVVAMAGLVLPACARRYRVEGMVVQVEPGRGTMLVSHRAVPGYMPAMVMPFRVESASELSDLDPGDRIAFELRVRKDGAVARKIAQSSRGLEGAGEEDLVLPDPAEKLPPGALVPDFALTDQTSRRVRLSDFRNRVVAVNFIYTRCPLPEVCPRLAASFARLQRRFAGRMGKDLVLLSITLDPQYDTPPVLSEYARKWRADADAWKFLSGPAGEIEAVARRFGVVYWPEEGLITHTNSTALIGRDGRLIARVEGSSFEPEQLGDLVAQYL